jgi:hypothetical protein
MIIVTKKAPPIGHWGEWEKQDKDMGFEPTVCLSSVTTVADWLMAECSDAEIYDLALDDNRAGIIMGIIATARKSGHNFAYKEIDFYLSSKVRIILKRASDYFLPRSRTNEPKS